MKSKTMDFLIMQFSLASYYASYAQISFLRTLWVIRQYAFHAGSVQKESSVGILRVLRVGDNPRGE
jgi:hypothetical protein